MEETLGKRISSARKRLGLTQDRLAELLGVTAQAVSKWENDQSCPDIGTLPKLACILGMTVDELLGTPRTVEAVAEPAPSAGEKSRPKVEISWNSGKKSMVGLAVWLLLLGGIAFFFGLRKWDLPFWTVAWSSGLLVYGIFGLFPRFSVFRLGCALVGGYFLAGTVLPLPSLGWPLMVIILGVLVLIRALQKDGKHSIEVHDWPHVKVSGNTSSFRTEGERFEAECHFGDKKNLITMDRLSSGTAEVSFGELTVDLSGCREIREGARVAVQCSFGELKVLVPESCRVVCGVTTAFGDCRIFGWPSPTAEKTIYIDGNVSCGQGTIQYI